MAMRIRSRGLRGLPYQRLSAADFVALANNPRSLSEALTDVIANLRLLAGIPNEEWITLYMLIDEWQVRWHDLAITARFLLASLQIYADFVATEMTLDDKGLRSLLCGSFEDFGFYRVHRDNATHSTLAQKCFLIPILAGTERPDDAKMSLLLGSRIQRSIVTMPAPAVTTATAVDFMLNTKPLWLDIKKQQPLQSTDPNEVAQVPSGAQVMRIVASELHSNFKAMLLVRPAPIVKAYSTHDAANVANAIAQQIEVAVDGRFQLADLVSGVMIDAATCAVGHMPLIAGKGLFRDPALQQLLSAGAVQLEPVPGNYGQFFVRLPLALLWRNRNAPHFSGYAASPLVHPGVHFEKLVFQHLLCRFIAAGVSGAFGDQLTSDQMFPAPWTYAQRLGSYPLFAPLSLTDYASLGTPATVIRLEGVQRKGQQVMAEMSESQWEHCIVPSPANAKFAAMTTIGHPLFDSVFATGNAHLFIGVKGSSYLMHKPPLLRDHSDFDTWCKNGLQFVKAYKTKKPGVIPVVVWVSTHPVDNVQAAHYLSAFSERGAALVIGAGPEMFASDGPFGIIRHRVLDTTSEWYACAAVS
eukprot:TRINITY_DN3580_c0_g1_i1.p1 TRINITY_DN3580_c0_g1~~TRINITY_DN3580_c0_g1_i1.p1  ORF type:complete len:639 (-),score=113.48 TRINITY_DN3580_c0_g1_i1:767-2515(-)